MNTKGSILILSLWILILLALFALSVAFRMRLATKIEGYEMKRFYTRFDYYSAVNLARYFITADEEPEVDSPWDGWYGQPDGFLETDFSEDFELEIIDEESKIDINRAWDQLLVSFFEVLESHDVRLASDPEDLTGDILFWRGQSTRFGKPSIQNKPKRMPFESLDELWLLPHIASRDVAILEPFFTVHHADIRGNFKVNINTVHPYILEAVVFSLQGGTSQKKEVWRKLKGALWGADDEDGDTVNARRIFQRDEITVTKFIKALELRESPLMVALVNQLLQYLTVDSQIFSVTVRSKRSKQRSQGLRAVLGPRIPIYRSRSSTPLSLGQRGYSMVRTTLDILAWHEGGV